MIRARLCSAGRWVAAIAILLAATGTPAAEDNGGRKTAEEAGNARATATTADMLGERPCGSPRSALRTLMLWQAPASRDLVRAATCIDRSGMEDPARDATERAEMLKKILDGMGLHLDFETIPEEPEFRDAAGRAVFELFPGRLGRVELVLDGKRWLFPPASLERIAELYRETYPFDLAAMMGTAPSWLRLKVAGVAVWQVFGILVLVALALLLQRLVIMLVSTSLHRLVRRLRPEWTGQVAHRAAMPLGGLAMAGAFAAGMPLLQFSLAVNRVGLFAARVLAAASLVWLGFRLVDVLSEFMADRATRTDTKMDDQLVPIVRKFLKFVLSLVGGVFILHNLDVSIGSLLAGLGLGGAALAFAAKDSLAHLFGSLMIFLDKPFQIGDFVKVGTEVEGTVEEVGFRSTRVRTPDDSLMTVPNAKMAESIVENLGARKHRRYRVFLGLTYDTPPSRIEAFCEGVRALLVETDGVVQDRSLVEFQNFGDSSLSVLLNCFLEAPDWATELRLRATLNLAILRLAERMEVQFAFPTRTIHVASMPERDDTAAN